MWLWRLQGLYSSSRMHIMTHPDVVEEEQIEPYKLLLARTGINPKKNSAIGELAKNIEIAIEQEKKINEDIHQCKGQITCNIGRIIDEIRNDDRK